MQGAGFIDMDLVPLERLGQPRGKGLRLPGDKLRVRTVRKRDEHRLRQQTAHMTDVQRALGVFLFSIPVRHTRRRAKRRFSLPPLLSITVISQEQARASSCSFARSPSWALKRRVFSLTHSSSQSSKALRAEALRRLSGNAPNTSTLTRPFICSTILFIS